MYNHAMTDRENALATICHGRPCRIGERVNMIFPREIADNVARGFVSDGLPFGPEDAGGKDIFGVQWVYEPNVRGSMVIPGAPMLEDIAGWEDRISPPDLEQINWAEVEKRCKPLVRTDMLNATMVFTGYFERLISLLDFENAAIAMIDEDKQEAVLKLFEMLTGYYETLFGKLRRHCGIDMITFHDDWGHQRSTFFSEDTCREMLLPYMKRLVASCHKEGMLFDFHSCGKVENFVPTMIEAGIDKWDGQPLNDIWALLEQYGSQICITLNVKMPNASPAEAEAWVDDILSHLTAGSGKNIFLPARGLCKTAKDTLELKSSLFYSH